MLNLSALTVIIVSSAISFLLYLAARVLIVTNKYRETFFQVWNAIGVAVLFGCLWLAVTRTHSTFPHISLVLLAIRFTVLFIQRILIAILAQQIGNLSPPIVEEWLAGRVHSSDLYTKLFKIAAYLADFIFVEVLGWLIAIIYKLGNLSWSDLWIIIGYTAASIMAIYLLSYQPLRRYKSEDLLRESFRSAAFDIPLSSLVLITYLVYSQTKTGFAVGMIILGYTLSKFIRYWATGLGLRRLLNPTQLIFYFQPVATIIMAIGFLNLS